MKRPERVAPTPPQSTGSKRSPKPVSAREPSARRQTDPAIGSVDTPPTSRGTAPRVKRSAAGTASVRAASTRTGSGPPRADPADRPGPSEREVRATQARARRTRERQERAQRRRFTRHSRRRRMTWLVVLGVLVVGAGLIAVAVFSPILALREIRVVGTSNLDPADISEAVSGQLGTPLALLDDAQIRQELGQFPLIRSFSTEMVPPGTLVISVVERTPLGVIATPGGFDTVDAAGVVLATATVRPDAMPLIESADTSGPAFASIVDVLEALPPDVAVRVDSITADTRDDVTLSLLGSSQRVVWGGASDSDRKADILAALLPRFESAGPGEYDVSAPGSAVFRTDEVLVLDE